MTEENKTLLDARAEAAKLADMYKSDPRQKTFNLLILGEMGTGKSFISRTARKPVHIDSFDPGGTKGLREYISRGEIMVDSRYESEDPMYPSMLPIWTEEMERRKNSGYFDHLGTYVIDSSTSWSEVIMNDVLKRAGRAGKPPLFTKDYTPQKTALRNYLRMCLDLPCDFILTGHVEPFKDEESGTTRFRFMSTGKGSIMIPTLFDEVWVTRTQETSKGNEYQVLTQSTDVHLARSRLAADGKISQYEKPNIKYLLKKVGMDCEDKELLI